MCKSLGYQKEDIEEDPERQNNFLCLYATIIFLKSVLLSKEIYRFNSILIKITMTFFMNL